MIDVKFTVETKDGNWFENINSIEECFSHDVKKIYETTFGTKQLLIYDNGNSQYNFNFMNGYFTVEALHQLQTYDTKHSIIYDYHMELIATEIDIMLGKECCIKIGFPVSFRRVKGRKPISSIDSKLSEKTTLKNILKEYHYSQFDSIFLELLSPDDLYMKSLILKRDNGLNKEDIKFNRMVKGKCSCRPYGADYKWLDYLQTIDYEE